MTKALGFKKEKRTKKYILTKRQNSCNVLNYYACCSDRKLLEQLNANIDYQMFYDLHIPPQYHLENYKIISATRCNLSAKLKIEEVQKILAKKWKGRYISYAKMISKTKKKRRVLKRSVQKLSELILKSIYSLSIWEVT